jgi:molybdopterin-guanine dinucleotide biosynthesis protein A
MGARDKGLLVTAEGRPVIEVLLAEVRRTFADAPVVLVGRADGYGALELPTLADEPADVGPIGGLVALCGRGTSEGRDVIAIACDMPFVTAALLQRLVAESADADAVVPCPAGFWQPLCAWYRADVTGAAARRVLGQGRRALHAVLDELGDGVRELSLTDAEAGALRDWDTDADVRRDGGRV